MKRKGMMEASLPASAVKDIEQRYGIELPAGHRAALSAKADPIHRRVILLTSDDEESPTIFTINDDLRATVWKEWPTYLLAFATNGCGDFFAYDLRHHPYPIYYLGPIGTAAEEVASCEQEGFVFPSFDEWYRYLASQSVEPTSDL